MWFDLQTSAWIFKCKVSFIHSAIAEKSLSITDPSDERNQWNCGPATCREESRDCWWSMALCICRHERCAIESNVNESEIKEMLTEWLRRACSLRNRTLRRFLSRFLAADASNRRETTLFPSHRSNLVLHHCQMCYESKEKLQVQRWSGSSLRLSTQQAQFSPLRKII